MKTPNDIIELTHLEGVYPLLDDLQAGFVLVGGDGEVRHVNYWARRLFKRRALSGHVRDLVGDEVFGALCRPVLCNETSGERWRELRIQGREAGVLVDIAVRSTAVRLEGDCTGVLLSMHDISGEVGLHKQNKELLDKQRRINEQLRIEIAAKLREHEDDLSQLSEILQVAPSIFASFLVEAESAIDSVELVIRKPSTQDSLQEALRAAHTLKGNARSLGLNHIGGRAHSVEDVLSSIQRRSDTVSPDDRTNLGDLLDDLRRARDRASFVRSRLTDSQSGAAPDLQRHVNMSSTQRAIADALELTPRDSQARGALEKAAHLMGQLCNNRLQELFEYLKATVATTSRSVGLDCPTVETRGGGIEVSADIYLALSEALPHLVRNAVTHGIEPAPERLDLGKSATGLVTISAEASEDRIELQLTDDGRGLDMDALRALAAERNLPEPDSPERLAQLLLTPGVTTASAVSADSGRGVGTSAAAQAISSIGGSCGVRSTAGRGTTFSIKLPTASA